MKTPRNPTTPLLLLAAALLVSLQSHFLFADDKLEATTTPDLEEVQNLEWESLRSVTCVSISKDGQFLYASAFNSGVVSVFKRDANTGLLKIDSWTEVPEFEAAVSVRLSPDNQYAAVSAFGANAVSLLKRDAETGALSPLDAAIEGQDGNAGLNFVIDAAFSADNHFLYTAASTGLGVFKIQDSKLKFVQSQTADGHLRGVRAVVLSPDGKLVYATGSNSDTVGVFRRNEDSGELETVQILTDGKDGINALAGAFRIACSADGKHVYVSSGRFQGDQAVSAFETQAGGSLKLIEEHIAGENGFTGFAGGNSIAINPDGKNVYALGSVSDQIARFRRDPASGKLTFLGSQLVGKQAVPGAAGLCFSPDGKFIYIADESASAIVVFKQP